MWQARMMWNTLLLGGGIDFDLVDYPSTTSTLLKWKELEVVQIFVAHYRGNFRPQVQLLSERKQETRLSILRQVGGEA